MVRASNRPPKRSWFYHLALDLAQGAPGKQRTAAVVVSPARVVIASDTCGRRASQHAEARALEHIDGDEARGSTLYVAKADGEPFQSCDWCIKKMTAAGIRMVVHVAEGGELRATPIAWRERERLQEIEDVLGPRGERKAGGE